MPIPSKRLIYLFKDASCKSGVYPLVFNARVFREWQIVKDVDGSGHGLNVGSPLGGTEKGHETF
jgi:hypothetical protein